MINVTVDVFSGRPNPSWRLDEAEAAPLLKQIALNRAMLSDHLPTAGGLGFRGIEISLESDDTEERYGLPGSFTIAHGRSPIESKALEVAESLVGGMLKTSFAAGAVPDPTSGLATLDASLQQYLQEQLQWAPRTGPLASDEGGADPNQAALTAVTCYIETGNFNPGFWNAPEYIRRNNCYNYASNRRTNTFAQPGRASGHMYTGLNCPAVTAAALADGLHQRGNCFPESERPRWFMALVIAPNRDYHWYRKSTEGFWGHKPGGTAARNTDNSGRIISDPRTADRGPYTQFCGFFYACKSQRIA